MGVFWRVLMLAARCVARSRLRDILILLYCRYVVFESGEYDLDTILSVFGNWERIADVYGVLSERSIIERYILFLGTSHQSGGFQGRVESSEDQSVGGIGAVRRFMRQSRGRVSFGHLSEIHHKRCRCRQMMRQGWMIILLFIYFYFYLDR